MVLYLTARVAVPIPGNPVPFTLQSFGVLVVGGALGFRRGGAAAFLYVALGVVGLPSFAEGKGGTAVLFGAIGGYLIGSSSRRRSSGDSRSSAGTGRWAGRSARRRSGPP